MTLYFSEVTPDFIVDGLFCCDLNCFSFQDYMPPTRRELISRGVFVTNLPKESGVDLRGLAEEADHPSGLKLK